MFYFAKVKALIHLSPKTNFMANFLAYFDLLGYKKFIENNTEEQLDYRTNHFGRNIEMALSLDHPTIPSKRPGVVISDISHSTLNCLTFSDTVIFWTNSNTFQDFEEVLKVAYKYNHFNVNHDFPSRGCIVYGDIWYKPFDAENLRGGKYMLNMIYGRALIEAHSKAEAMSWAGCVLDTSAIEYAKTLGNIDNLLEEYTLLYDIPYKTKDAEVKHSGHALRLAWGRVLLTEYMEQGIMRVFTQDNKGEIEGRTKAIFDHTIEFLKTHRIKFPYYYQMSSTMPDNIKVKIFGKLEEDYTHTIIKVLQQDGQDSSYDLQVIKFDRDKSERDFLDAELISPQVFEEQLKKTQK
jgi:hypothetical protein